MHGSFFKDIKDIDFVVRTEKDKHEIEKILLDLGYKPAQKQPIGHLDYENDLVSIEFGSAENPKNSFYNSLLDENNFAILSSYGIFTILNNLYKLSNNINLSLHI